MQPWKFHRSSYHRIDFLPYAIRSCRNCEQIFSSGHWFQSAQRKLIEVTETSNSGGKISEKKGGGVAMWGRKCKWRGYHLFETPRVWAHVSEKVARCHNELLASSRRRFTSRDSDVVQSDLGCAHKEVVIEKLRLYYNIPIQYVGRHHLRFGRCLY